MVPNMPQNKKFFVDKEVLFTDILLLLLCMKDEASHIKQSFKLFVSLKT